MVEAVRKVNLGRALDLLRCLFPAEYNFHPRSWFLPQQYVEFCEAVKSWNSQVDNGTTSPCDGIGAPATNDDGKIPADTTTTRPVFIVKPDEGSQGEGIYLIQA